MLFVYNKYLREIELFIYYIFGFIKKEIGFFKIIILIGLNSRNSILLFLFIDFGLSLSV